MCSSTLLRNCLSLPGIPFPEDDGAAPGGRSKIPTRDQTPHRSPPPTNTKPVLYTSSADQQTDVCEMAHSVERLLHGPSEVLEVGL